MKKKAVLSTALSVMLAGAMCVGFAACGDDAESMKSDRLTAEEWAAAFSDENFENVKIEYSANSQGEGVSEELNAEIIIENDKLYAKMFAKGFEGDESGEDHDEYYENKTQDALVTYFNVDGVWKVGNSPNGDYIEYHESISSGADDGIASGEDYTMRYSLRIFEQFSQFIAIIKQYESFEYNEEKGGYVMKSDAYMSIISGSRALVPGSALAGLGSTVYKFKDGKLAAIWYEYAGIVGSVNGEPISGTVTKSTTFTYGGQSVTLPEVA